MTDDVSRETAVAPSTPSLARRAFPSERLPLAERYADLLADGGVVRGLIGPREATRLWDRHLLNCAALAEVVAQGARVCDVGSGAGLPGLVLAIARPDVEVTLLEPLLRRTTFLSEVVEDLGLGEQVRVDRGRAEERHGIATYDVVTSRAVAPLDRLLGWCMPLAAAEGSVIAMKGSSVREEIPTASTTLSRLGCSTPEVLEIGADWLTEPTLVVRVAWADPAAVWSAGGVGRDRRSGSARSMPRTRRGSR